MMIKMPQAPISVIIPCYRAGETIERSLESVYQQTVLPKQVILVDDASNDSSVQKLFSLQKDYSAAFPEIHIVIEVLQKNGGPGLARNRGWDLAAQDWIAFLDADDSWHPQKLEIQFQWIQNHSDVSLLGGLTQEVPPGKSQNPVVALDAKEMKAVSSQTISVKQMAIANRFMTRTVMLRRNLPFRFQARRHAEDYLLWLEILLAGFHGAVLNQVLAYSYRPAYSAGGLSGQLWKHEKRELGAWIFLYRENKISALTLMLTLPWSYLKYLRRVLKRSQS